MEKVQMTVTVSETALLAYLGQFTGARERSFMLRMLALRGLQSCTQAAAAGDLWPPIAAAPVSAPPQATPSRASAEVSTARPVHPQHRAQTALDEAATSVVTSITEAAGLADHSPVSNIGGQYDPLAGIDIGALNAAMERY